MIIFHSSQSTVMRVPKTGSTSLEATLRFAGCVKEGDISPAVDDAMLPDKNVPVAAIEKYSASNDRVQSFIKSARRERIEAKENNREVIQLTPDPATMADIESRRKVKTGVFEQINLQHATLDDITDGFYAEFGMLTEEQVYTYNHYAYLRNPFDRVISSFLFSNQRRQNVDMQMFHDVVTGKRGRGLQGLEYRSQIDYFTYRGETHHRGIGGKRIVTPMLFDNYQQEMIQLVSRLNGISLAEFPRFKQQIRGRINPLPTVENWIEPYPEIKSALIHRYGEDIDLWEEISGIYLT